VAELAPDPRVRRVHYDWLEAGEHTQRTVAQLSQQLRRFLDDQAYLENRRIMDLLHGIEAHALALRDAMPQGEFTTIADTAASIELPMERPLHRPPQRPQIVDRVPEAGEVALDAGALFSQVVIDKARLARHVRQALQNRSQITLRELVERHPLQQGLAELVAYLQIAGERPRTAFDEGTREPVCWQTADGGWKRAELPRVIFTR
jgi:hypothetical protein